MLYKSFIKPLLFRLEAEQAHDLTHRLAEKASENSILQLLTRILYGFQSSRLKQNFWGLSFRNPIGLAAGFDKNGKIPEITEALGMGFTEVGSMTANACTGNPKPRSFRLPEDHALINRMGLNNDGVKTIVKRLKNKSLTIPLGVNIAKTHDPSIMGDDAIRDYQFSFREAQEIADYITINISCPNTKEGKTFENPAILDELLSALNIKADASMVPSLIKFSSDLSRKELVNLLDICEKHRIHGYVASNTSSDRSDLKTDPSVLTQIGPGGLSGPPVFEKSLQLVKWINRETNGQKPIIGVGGIDSFERALTMLKAGASLLQIYTGLIYEGPSLVKTINRKLSKYLKARQADSLLQLPTLKY